MNKTLRIYAAACCWFVWSLTQIFPPLTLDLQTFVGPPALLSIIVPDRFKAPGNPCSGENRRTVFRYGVELAPVGPPISSKLVSKRIEQVAKTIVTAPLQATRNCKSFRKRPASDGTFGSVGDGGPPLGGLLNRISVVVKLNNSQYVYRGSVCLDTKNHGNSG